MHFRLVVFPSENCGQVACARWTQGHFFFFFFGKAACDFLLSKVSVRFYFWLHWVFTAVCRLSLVAASGQSSVGAHRLLVAVVSLIGGQSLGTRDQPFWLAGWVVGVHGLSSSVGVAPRLSCPAICGIFPDQGSNLCLLRWQADS